MSTQAGSWKRAMLLLTEMYAQGMRPAGFAVAATIRACSSVGEWRKGLEVLRQSQQVKPSKPDPCTLGAAIQMCCRAGELVSDADSCSLKELKWETIYRDSWRTPFFFFSALMAALPSFSWYFGTLDRPAGVRVPGARANHLASFDGAGRQ